MFIMFIFFFKNIWFAFKYVLSRVTGIERRVVLFVSMLFLSSEWFRLFTCSWMLRQHKEMTFWEFCGWSLCIFTYVFIRRRAKNKKKKIKFSNILIQSYVYLRALKNNFDVINFSNIGTYLYNVYNKCAAAANYLGVVIKNNYYFLNKGCFKLFTHTINANNYTKVNKNYRRYSDILKKYK